VCLGMWFIPYKKNECLNLTNATVFNFY
jgi:hypothetical protein